MGQRQNLLAPNASDNIKVMLVALTAVGLDCNLRLWSAKGSVSDFSTPSPTQIPHGSSEKAKCTGLNALTVFDRYYVMI